MRQLFLLTSCIISCCSYCQTTAKYNTEDIQALNAIAAKWQHYWNIHDMDSMGTLLTNDVDFITVAGVWLKGKQAAVKDHKEKHLGVKFSNSIWQTDSVDIKYVKTDLAIMHIGWGISADFEDDGTPRQPRHGLFTWLVIKQNNKWRLLAVQNTNVKETMVANK